MAQIDNAYMSLVRDIIAHGYGKDTRSGTVCSVFGRQIRHNIMLDGFPLLTVKKMFTKGMIHELLWFLKGNTNIKYLVENKTHIWDDDAYRYYIEKGGKDSKEDFLQGVLNQQTMGDYTYGDLGPVYGKQWRNWLKPNGESVDQIQSIIETLKSNPDDRRLLCVAFNPGELDQMALPPCHVMFQFYTRPLTPMERLQWLTDHYDEYDEWKFATKETLDNLKVPQRALSLMWIQRSVDVGLGLPFNIASYALLLCMIAQVVDMVPEEIVGSLGDCHIYFNHYNGMSQLSKNYEEGTFNACQLKLNPNIKNIDDFSINDIQFESYQSYGTVPMPLSVG